MEHPNLPLIIFIAISTGIVVGFISYTYFRFYAWSAVTMAIIIAYLIVNINYPIGSLLQEPESYVIGIYLIIEIIIPIYLFATLIIMLFLFARSDGEYESLKEEDDLKLSIKNIQNTGINFLNYMSFKS
jgi:hypothetical protein